MKCSVCNKKLVGAVLATANDGLDPKVGYVWQSGHADVILCCECNDMLAFVRIPQLSRVAKAARKAMREATLSERDVERSATRHSWRRRLWSVV